MASFKNTNIDNLIALNDVTVGQLKCYR